jgi:hypothetical protein
MVLPCRVVSEVSVEDVEEWALEYGINEWYRPRAPEYFERMDNPRSDEIAVYPEMFQSCVRLPFNHFLNHIFDLYDLAPCQFTPDFYRYVVGFLLICGVQGVQPNFCLWNYIFHVVPSSLGQGWYDVRPLGKYKCYIDVGSRSHEDWWKRFFFVRRESRWDLESGWGRANVSLFRAHCRPAEGDPSLSSLLAWEAFEPRPLRVRDLTTQRAEFLGRMFDNTFGTIFVLSSLFFCIRV